MTTSVVQTGRINAAQEPLKSFSNSLPSLQKGLKAGNTSEVQQWLNSAQFKPFFDEFYRVYEEPRRQSYKDQGKPVPRDIDFNDAVEHFAVSESAGEMKFTGPTSIMDKSTWDSRDHHAYFLHIVTMVNTDHKMGILRWKQMTAIERKWAMWQALRYAKSKLASSKINRGSKQQCNAHNSDKLTALERTPDQSRSQSLAKNQGDDGESHRAEDCCVDLGSAEYLRRERQHDRYHKSDRYWVLYGIRQIVKAHFDEFEFKQALIAAGVRAQDLNFLNAASDTWEAEFEQDLGAALLDNDELTQGDKDRLALVESWTRTPELEVSDSTPARQALGLWGDQPRLPGMPLSTYIHFWQIPAIHRVTEIAKEYTGAILADAMGLGKTVVMIGHILHEHCLRGRALREGLATGPPRPKLILVPASLVQQTIDKLNQFTVSWTILRYHEDDRKSIRPGHIKGLLHTGHPLFDKITSSNDQTIIVSSHQTWATRHGPTALRKWRINTHLMSSSAASHPAAMQQVDYNCPAVLRDCFDLVWVDEAHQAKRADSRLNICLQWMQLPFVGLATATPNKNRLSDSRGYLQLIQPRQILTPTKIEAEAWGVDNPKFNPYDLPMGHPAVGMRLDMTCADRHIFSQDDPVAAGYHMSKLAELYTIRRTYASVVDGQVLGQAIPPLIRRYLDLEFSPRAQAWYDDASFYANKNLVSVDADSNLIWNAKYYRKLVLLSTWVGFEYIETNVYADTLPKWKQEIKEGNLTLRWLHMVYNGLTKDGYDADSYFHMPAEDDHLEQVRIVCLDAPKIAAIIALCEDVVRYGRKIAFWTLLPAQQLLIYDILQKIGIDVHMYSSDMNQDDRDHILHRWNTEADACQVLLLSFSMNSCGLDLQYLCHQTVNVDIPISRAIRDQADHRFRRLGQKHDVYSYVLSVRRTFDDRQLQNHLSKATGNVMSELNRTIFNVEKDPDRAITEFSIGNWTVIDDKLMPSDHPDVLAHRELGFILPELSPMEVLRQILSEEHGKWTEIIGMGEADALDEDPIDEDELLEPQI